MRVCVYVCVCAVVQSCIQPQFPDILRCSCCFSRALLPPIAPGQLGELLKGFYDIIPARLITPFDFQELELLVCGLATIDVNDWRTNTVYQGGIFHADHPVICWFWEVVDSLTHTQQSKLLQFTTGTSGVPVQGFGGLMSFDGAVARFTVENLGAKTPPPTATTRLFPRAHTCFNRISLPLYSSMQQLREFLTLAIEMEMRLDLT